MERYINVNRLVNRLTDNEALRTYYTLILMSETSDAKTLIDNQFWQKFDLENDMNKAQMRIAFQQAERNLLAETQRLKQELNDYKTSMLALKVAA